MWDQFDPTPMTAQSPLDDGACSDVDWKVHEMTDEELRTATLNAYAECIGWAVLRKIASN